MTIASARPSPVVRWYRIRNSRAIGWGNLGAPPQPPRLRSNEPESYNELYSRLKDMSEVLLPAGKSTMRQFVRIYKWCEDHGIKLEFLGLSPNLHKYREATAYLTRVISKNTCDDEIKREVLETVNRIKSDKNRDETRSWTRKKRTGS